MTRFIVVLPILVASLVGCPSPRLPIEPAIVPVEVWATTCSQGSSDYSLFCKAMIKTGEAKRLDLESTNPRIIRYAIFAPTNQKIVEYLVKTSQTQTAWLNSVTTAVWLKKHYLLKPFPQDSVPIVGSREFLVATAADTSVLVSEKIVDGQLQRAVGGFMNDYQKFGQEFEQTCGFLGVCISDLQGVLE